MMSRKTSSAVSERADARGAGPRAVDRCRRGADPRERGGAAGVGAALRLPGAGSGAERAPPLFRAPRGAGSAGAARSGRGLVARGRDQPRRDEDASAPSRIESSIFAGVRRRRPDLPVYDLSHRAMLAISHAIEDEYCATCRTPDPARQLPTGRALRARRATLARARAHGIADRRVRGLRQESCAARCADRGRAAARRVAPARVGGRVRRPRRCRVSGRRRASGAARVGPWPDVRSGVELRARGRARRDRGRVHAGAAVRARAPGACSRPRRSRRPRIGSTHCSARARSRAGVVSYLAG